MNNEFGDLKKKKVAIICPTLSRGGAERVVGLLSKQIESSVEDIFLLLFNTDEITYDYGGKIIDLGFKKNFKISRYKLLNRIRTTKQYFKLLMEIRKQKKQLDIDVSISFMDTPNIINILSRVRDRIVLSVRINKSIQDNKHNIILSKKIEIILMKLLYKYSDRIIAASEGIKLDLLNNFNLKENLLTTIYNFTDVDNIIELKNKSIPDQYEYFFENHEVIINVGRFEYQKNQINLLEEFEMINREFENTRLVLIGQGTLENRIREKINELKISDKVLIIPYTTNPFMYINRTKIFVLNSYFEGYPNTLLEAMACGVPIISTDCKSGPREIIANKFDYYERIREVKTY